MPLIDEVVIKARGGKGGDGSKSFTINYGSQKRVPNGGNGGDGGNVYVQGSHNLTDLSEFRFKKEIKAEDGESGQHKNLVGKKGKDKVFFVPLGTTIIDEKNNVSHEISNNDEKILIAKGGRKGYGNHDYKIDKSFSPRRDKGEEGEEKDLKLILNIIADIGLIGLPNAGKSSLLSKITNANPKIGNYAFTTTEPNLGTLENLIIADIPGLIEGANKGRGLGHSFLKHIKKTKMLVHLIDSSSLDVLNDYKTITSELSNFDRKLTEKKEIIVLTKIDLVDQEKLIEDRNLLKNFNKKIYTVSIYNEGSLLKIKKSIKEEFNNN